MTLPKKLQLEETLSTILYFEDDLKLILDKPYGLPSHQTKDPKRKDFTTLVGNALEYPNLRTLNRLDLNTTGLIILGKTSEDQSSKEKNKELDLFLSNCQKTYLFIAQGIPGFESQTIKNHMREDQEKMKIVFSGGKVAITHLTVLSKDETSKLWLGKARIETGRRHQIRLHLSHLGHPLLGDTLYGGKGDRIFLHSAVLGWKSGEEWKEIQSDCPDFWSPIFSEWEDKSIHGLITNKNKKEIR